MEVWLRNIGGDRWVHVVAFYLHYGSNTRLLNYIVIITILSLMLLIILYFNH